MCYLKLPNKRLGCLNNFYVFNIVKGIQRLVN